MKPGGSRSVGASALLLPTAVLIAVAIGFIPPYRPVLGYFFTGTDTLTLIETSRIESASDVAEILGKPLMWGSDFVQRGSFYRPVAALSYGLDYALRV